MNKKKYKFEYKQKVTDKINSILKGKETIKLGDLKQSIPELEKLTNITIKIQNEINNKPPITKVNNIYELISSENLSLISYNKIKRNDGAGTKGSIGQSIENMSLEDIKDLTTQLEEKTFKWKPIKTIEIPRPNKAPRPLGIPNFTEKIIQNNILMVLEAIYEPIFENTNKNYGFRPNKSTKTSIFDITRYSNQGLNYSIEGDIKGAFDNVHPETLINILKKHIADKDFLNLIYENCITPIIKNGKIIPSPLGTFQGSCVSPMLFNIYAQLFDEYIIEIIQEIEQTENINRKTRSIAHKYAKKRDKVYKTGKQQKNIEKTKLYRNLTKNEKTQLQKIKKNKIKLIKERSRLNSVDLTKQKIRIYYNRYCDDFIILTNQYQEYCEKLKNKIAEFLKTKLKLTLSPEKTLITDISKKPVKYLGYTIFMTKRGLVRTTKNHLAGPNKLILTGIDLNRQYNQLIEQKFATEKTLKPRSAPYITLKTPYEIIEYYNTIIIGKFDYFYDLITYKSTLARIHYILYYSCISTLAQKFRTTTRGIMKRFGWYEMDKKYKYTNRKRITASRLTQKSKSGKIKREYITLLNYTDIYDISETKLLPYLITNKNGNKELNRKKYELEKLNTPRNINYTKEYIINLRTRFKFEGFCEICGAENVRLHIHHLKKISGPTIDKKSKTKAFFQIMSNLNRKQLTVCHPCHVKIHNGEYTGTSLEDLYDIRLSNIENTLKLDTKTPNNKITYPLAEGYGKLTYLPQYYTIINNRKKAQTDYKTKI